MAAFLTAPVMLALLVFNFPFFSAGQINIRAEPGENVTLTCRAAENKKVIVVEWSRTDLESDQYVILYVDSQSDPDGQSPSFRNRVDLLDMNNGDVSLVLKNVTTDDTGTYECRVDYKRNNRRKRSQLGGDPISVVNLTVGSGNKDELKEDGGKEGGKDNTALIGGLLVFAGLVLLVVAAVVVFLLRRRKRNSSSKPNPPPASEAQPLQDKKRILSV